MGFKLNPITGKFDLTVTGGVGGIGNVVGAASSVDNTVVRMDGTTGKLIQGSVVVISDAGAVSAVTQLDVDNIRIDGSTISNTVTNDNIIITPNGTGALIVGASAVSPNGDLILNRIAISQSALSATAAVNGVTTSSTIRTSLNFDLTYSGASGGLTNIVSTSKYAGSATTSVNAALLASAVHSINTVTVSGTTSGVDARISMASANTLSAGTHVFSAITTSLGQTGGTHSGGTVRVYGIRQQPMTNTFASVGSETKWGAFFGNDVALASNARLYLEGSETAKGDSYLVFNTASTDINIVVDNTITLNIDNDLVRSEVALGALAGASTTYAKVGGTINTNTTAVGNVGTGEDDLMTYTIPASTLATNGDRIEFKMAGTFAANANTKRVKVKYGATTIFDTTAIAFNGTDWSLEGLVIRTGAATQKAYVDFRSSDVLLNSSSDYTTPAETLSGTVVLKATGEATSNNDISQEIMAVKWQPVQ